MAGNFRAELEPQANITRDRVFWAVPTAILTEHCDMLFNTRYPYSTCLKQHSSEEHRCLFLHAMAQHSRVGPQFLSFLLSGKPNQLMAQKEADS